MTILESIKNDVRKIIENDSAHDFEHILRVYHNAQKILKKEKAKQKISFKCCIAS